MSDGFADLGMVACGTSAPATAPPVVVVHSGLMDAREPWPRPTSSWTSASPNGFNRLALDFLAFAG